MADDVTFQSATPATPPDGTIVAADVVGGVSYQRVKPVHGADGTVTDTSAANPLPVVQTGSPALPTGAATDGKLDTIITSLATVDGHVDGLEGVAGTTADAAVVTDTNGTNSGKLRGLVKWAFERMPASLGQKTKAASFPVVIASDQDTLVVSGPLTDTQLRATPVPVSGTVTATTGGLTDTQLRATPVPISGTVTASGPLTDTQLRNSAVPVSLSSTTVTGTVAVTDNAGSLTVDSTQLPAALGSGTTAQSLKVALATDQVAIPVTDNSSSLTVDAPVATPVFTRLSDGAAALVGQKAMTASLPVVLASDQASVPVAATLTAETTKVIGSVRNLDGLGNSTNSSGPGFLRVTDEPKQVFYDPFDGTFLDTTTRWTATFGLGVAVLPSQVSGTVSVDAGATSTGWSRLVSQPTFVPPIPAWLGGSAAISLPDGAAPPATGTRFWGFGSPALIPTTSAAVVDGVGFEMRSGKLYAVVYANSVRTDIADLSAATGTATQPTDALNHRYIVQVRTDRTYWYIDSLATPVATSSFQSPVVQTLPYTFVSVSGGSATRIDSAGIAVWDTGKNATQIADGIAPWRKQTVKAGNTVPTTADNPAVVTLHPSSPPTAAQPVYDDLNRRLLEEILIEMRTNNALLMQVFPNGHLQADTRPDLRLAQ